MYKANFCRLLSAEHRAIITKEVSVLTRFEKALAFATEKHQGQTRKGGEPYIMHPVAVAQLLKEQDCDEDTQICGLFHDLLEDTDATEEEICQYGNEAILEAVRLLTKQKGYRMAVYIAAIKANPMAKAVKAADRLHNLRCAIDTDEAFRHRYIRESRDWYLDFSPTILPAVEVLEESLQES